MKTHSPLAHAFFVLFLFTIQSCSASNFTTQHFSFPPESQPHETHWQYIGFVKVSSSDNQAITKKSKKDVWVKIVDKEEREVLNEKMQFDSASIQSTIIWIEHDSIQIELHEVGNKYSNDSYNNDLLKSGPVLLAIINYKYDSNTKLFRRVK